MNEITVAPNELLRKRRTAGIVRPEDLAASAGIDAQEYEHIEAGRLLPSVEQLRRLQAALAGGPADRL